MNLPPEIVSIIIISPTLGNTSQNCLARCEKNSSCTPSCNIFNKPIKRVLYISLLFYGWGNWSIGGITNMPKTAIPVLIVMRAGIWKAGVLVPKSKLLNDVLYWHWMVLLPIRCCMHSWSHSWKGILDSGTPLSDNWVLTLLGWPCFDLDLPLLPGLVTWRL